jgi:hypothetical protein
MVQFTTFQARKNKSLLTSGLRDISNLRQCRYAQFFLQREAIKLCMKEDMEYTLLGWCGYSQKIY